MVKEGWFRAFVDDREIASEKIGANPEPWPALHAASPEQPRELKNPTINGTPTIPEKIDLLANDDLGMWRPYMGFVAGRNQNGSGWEKRGEEMHEFGQKP